MTYSYTNYITDYINKKYNVKVCSTQQENNSYYTITEIYKCNLECMNVKGTLYIYCCNYEDALRKASNFKTTKEKITINTILTDRTDTIYLQIEFNIEIPIDTKSSAGQVEIVELTINDEETEEIIIPKPK